MKGKKIMITIVLITLLGIITRLAFQPAQTIEEQVMTTEESKIELIEEVDDHLMALKTPLGSLELF
tara:strand:+ start:545 stop:742 length:198 start_codon:yes stop_codon:yes gene_type:complete